MTTHLYLKDLPVHETMSSITNLFKELAVKILLTKTADASDIAGRIRDMFLEAQEVLDATIVGDTPKMIIADSIGTLGKKPIHTQQKHV